MNVRNLIVTLFTLAGLFLCTTNRSQDHQGFINTPADTRWADGGKPVPPLPPVSSTGTLTADGGKPVPPLPPVSSTGTLTADGGRPVPPLPPSIIGVFDSGAAS
jgi:hypothetical protein